MKKTLFFLVVFMGGLFFANALDKISLKDGSVIDAKIMEMHPGEIRYKRADNLNGPMFFLPMDRVLSIRYENGVVDIINASPAAVPQPAAQTPVAQAPAAQAPVVQAPSVQTAVAQTPVVQAPGLQAALQNTLNTLPAITIAGNNLKFQFSGENWTALLNGESFSAGTVEVEETKGGSLLTLRQTHIWPGAAAGKAAGKLGGKLAGKVPGGSAVAGAALDAAGKAAGPVESSGPAMVLEYKAGPPAKLTYLKNAKPAAQSAPKSTSQTASAPAPTTAPSVQSAPASAPAPSPTVTPDLQSVPVVAQSPENPAPPSNHRYEVVEKSATWATAKKEAEKRGGYLAVINDAEEQKMIENMISTGKKDRYWIGGFREGRVWKWVNDEPMNYTNWAPGEPNNQGGENKLEIYRTPYSSASTAKLGQWNDLPNNTSNGYIIEWD